MRTAGALACVLSVAACSGGGGGGNDNPGGSSNQPPEAVLEANTTQGSAPLTITLDGSSSSDPDGQIAAYRWQLGDGKTAHGPSVSHTYSTPGTYTIRLTVTDEADATASATTTVTVAANQPPRATFSAQPSQALAPVEVSLDASASSDPDGNIASYAWRFGDSDRGQGEEATHTYAETRQYTVTLTVTDDAGATDSTSRVLELDGFQIAGTLRAAGNQSVDSDTNDPATPTESNDTAASAQALAQPVTLGGFVTAEPTGDPDDAFGSTADPDDIYQITLSAGQTVNLRIADHQDSGGPDLDLYLYNTAGELVKASEGTAETETVTAEADGTYYLRVHATSGRSNYLLSTGTTTQAAGNRLSRKTPIVPGEVLVQFDRQQLTAAGTSTTAAARSLGFTLKGGGAGKGPVRLGFAGADRRRNVLKALDAAPRMAGIAGGAPMSKKARRKGDVLRVVKALRKRADVAAASPNYRRRALRTPEDPYYDRQWHYPLINLPQAWAITTADSAKPPVVAVVDTGVLPDHPDLQGQFLTDAEGAMAGYDFVSDPERAGDGDGIDPDPTDPGDGGTGSSSSFHGTHVAGTVAAATSNGTGVAGVAWGARLLPVRVLGIGGGTTADIIQGVRYAAGLTNDAGATPPRAADVINLSLGGPGSSSVAQTTFTEVAEAGTLVVAAAGNDGTTEPRYPANYDGVTAVGAVDLQKELAPYSQRGDWVDLVAPGGDTGADRNGDGFADGVLSTHGDDSVSPTRYTYSFLEGTSMAAPHVAGVAALMRALDPDFEHTDLRAALRAGELTEDLGPTGKDDRFGYGLINALAAVEQAGSGTVPPVLGTEPSGIDFGIVTAPSARTLTLSNAGAGSLSVTDVTHGGSGWLSVTAGDDVGGDGLGDYTVTVEPAGQSAGLYRADITITTQESDGGETYTVPASMQIPADTTAEADAGYQYVLLVPPGETEAARQASGAFSDGRLPYRLEKVTAGDYRLVAGSDMDNDGQICDAGESCGAYPVLGSVETVPVAAGNSDKTGLDFLVGFRLAPSDTAAFGGAMVPADGLALPGTENKALPPETVR